MVKCPYFTAIEIGFRENCANCQRWKGERCRDEHLLRDLYEDTKRYRIYNRMMRDNKGIKGPL